MPVTHVQVTQLQPFNPRLPAVDDAIMLQELLQLDYFGVGNPARTRSIRWRVSISQTREPMELFRRHFDFGPLPMK